MTDNNLKLYDTMSRSVRTFVPITKHHASIYSCGPTVYNYPHVGNWSAYIYWDVLVRTLELAGYQVNWYMNITDVGHLVSDDDSGEDKLEKGAKREGKTAWEVADFYTKDFLLGLDNLNIQIPHDHLVKATDNIQIQIDLISKLEEKGFTYQISDGIYFDSTKFKDYGKLARLDIGGLQAGARVDIKDKKHPTDFALWKFSPKGQTRDMEWDSPWGKGFPGWHIECSAMAMDNLGSTLDIHTGGIDHIPVHHTNEIAQSEAATGQTFVNYWLHNNFMNIAGEKIAKSEGNVVLLADIAKKGFSLKAYRLMVLQSHYRSQSNFTWEILNSAQQRLLNWQATADQRFQRPMSNTSDSSNDDLDAQLDSIKQDVMAHLMDDLNTPEALVSIEKGIELLSNSADVTTEQITKYFDFINQAVGIDLLSSSDISQQQKEQLVERQAARDKKDWAKADELRQKLAKNGIEVRDQATQQSWYRSKID